MLMVLMTSLFHCAWKLPVGTPDAGNTQTREGGREGGSVLVCVIQCVKNNEEMTARLVASSFSLACSLVI